MNPDAQPALPNSPEAQQLQPKAPEVQAPPTVDASEAANMAVTQLEIAQVDGPAQARNALERLVDAGGMNEIPAKMKQDAEKLLKESDPEKKADGYDLKLAATKYELTSQASKLAELEANPSTDPKVLEAVEALRKSINEKKAEIAKMTDERSKLRIKETDANGAEREVVPANKLEAGINAIFPGLTPTEQTALAESPLNLLKSKIDLIRNDKDKRVAFINAMGTMAGKKTDAEYKTLEAKLKLDIKNAPTEADRNTAQAALDGFNKDKGRQELLTSTLHKILKSDAERTREKRIRDGATIVLKILLMAFLKKVREESYKARK